MHRLTSAGVLCVWKKKKKVPDHHEHLWACSWLHQSPCWPGQRRPPWRPAQRTSYGLGRFPVRKQEVCSSHILLTAYVVDTLETGYKQKASEHSFMSRESGKQTSTVRWAMMARWCPSSVSSAIWAISPSDLPINIWQAVANISLFWPWIFTCKKTGEASHKQKRDCKNPPLFDEKFSNSCNKTA